MTGLADNLSVDDRSVRLLYSVICRSRPGQFLHPNVCSRRIANGGFLSNDGRLRSAKIWLSGHYQNEY